MAQRSTSTCVVPGCSNDNQPLFSFPRTAILRKKWIEAIPNLQDVFPDMVIEDLPYSTLIHYRICHRHFQDEHFQTAVKKKLNRGVVPTIFCPRGIYNTFITNLYFLYS